MLAESSRQMALQRWRNVCRKTFVWKELAVVELTTIAVTACCCVSWYGGSDSLLRHWRLSWLVCQYGQLVHDALFHRPPAANAAPAAASWHKIIVAPLQFLPHEQLCWRSLVSRNSARLSVRLSGCPSFTRMLCDKTKQCTAGILIPHEREITLVFWHQQRLAGNAPFRLKVALKVTHPFEKRRLRQISAYNVSTVKEIAKKVQLEKVKIMAMYCHLRPPDAISFPTYHFKGLRIWAADKSNVVSFRVAVGRHVNADYSVCDGLERNKIMRVGEKVRSRVKPFADQNSWKFWDNVGDPSHYPVLLSDCLCRVSFRRYSPLSVEVVEKPNKLKNGPPIVFGGTTPTLLW